MNIWNSGTHTKKDKRSPKRCFVKYTVDAEETHILYKIQVKFQTNTLPVLVLELPASQSEEKPLRRNVLQHNESRWGCPPFKHSGLPITLS